MTSENNSIENVNEEIVIVDNDGDIAEESASIPVKHPDNPTLWSFLKALYDPTDLSRKTGKIQWFLFPILPAVCYALFALQLFLENVGTGVRAGNFLIVPIGALCGYALTLISCLILFIVFKIMRKKSSFKNSVAVISGSFVGSVLLEIISLIINICTPLPTAANLGAFGIFFFMIPLTCFTAKNSKGKVVYILLLSLISVINVVLLCLMIKVGGVA